MANETTLVASLSNTRSGATIAGQVSAAINQTNAPGIGNIQIIGITTEALVYGDVTAPGYLYVKNTDATNFVQIGLATPVTSGNAFAKLLPGEALVIPTRQTVVYALADTANCNCHVVVVSI